MKQHMQTGVFIVLILTICTRASDMVPFVIPVDIHPDSQIAMSYQPLTESARLSAKAYFLTNSGERVRLWGVNLTFGANFPAHADAERIARRMAAFGINAVRCHHMDTANWPRGLWDSTGRDLHPEALDRLDYFIDQLAKHGIYTDLNLHVGRKHSAALGLLESPTDYDKMVNIFTPELIEAQKDFARKLLTHKNPYRDNVSYAEDYAVAIVEITNENSLFMWGADNTLRTLPDFYADILQKQYNRWLAKKYTTHAALKQAWLHDSEPLGENLIKNADMKNADYHNTAWNLEQHAGCRAEVEAKAYKGQQGLCIRPAKIDGTGWHLQYNQGLLSLKKDQVYTVEFAAAAPAQRLLNIGVLQAHDPWQNLGLSQSVTITPEWKTYRMSFVASDEDDNARLSFYFGEDDKPFCLADVSLRPGVEYTLDKNESLDTESIALFGEVESPRRRMDRMIFLAETEKAYFDDMRNYIKKDLNCKAMVTGTIVFGPLGLYAQSDMDFIDSHAYWQHPRFPNRSWDPGDWLIDQKAMSDNPPGTLLELAAERLSGKPFTVTEYNHPAPLDAQAEGVPMIASFAAAQDWDGVWLYTYSHSSDSWDRQHLNSYFDIDTNPAKWGFMPAGAMMFRDASIQPFRQQVVSAMTTPQEDLMDALAEFHIRIDRNLAANLRSIFERNPAIAFYHTFQADSKTAQSRTGGRYSMKSDLRWDVVNNEGLYVLRNDRCVVVNGHTKRFAEVSKPVDIRIDTPAMATVTVLLDGVPGFGWTKLLITACGRCENTGMQFSEDRRTVGRNWGTAPVRIEPVEGVITLDPADLTTSAWTCKILNPDGTVKEQFRIENGIIPLKPEYGTMWYLIERTPTQ